MDYEEFRNRVNKYVISPTNEQKQRLIHGNDTMHFQLSLSRHTYRELGDKYQMICDTIHLIEERGGVFQEDFFVNVFVDREDAGSQMVVVLHFLDSFVSEEDFSGDIPVIK